jgi:hypothetical protein
VRVAAQVALAYAVMLVLGVVWRVIPSVPSPEVAAVFAAYLGLTARVQLAPATFGAVLIGYLADLLLGTPRGMSALTAGIICVAAHLFHRRLLVRGWAVSTVFSAAVGVATTLLYTIVRATMGLPLWGAGAQLTTLALTALVTGLAGPVFFRACRLLDARFARTAREREAALQGLIP